MSSRKRPIPDGFAVDARTFALPALKNKYSASQETVQRWLTELGITDRKVVAKARKVAVKEMGEAYPCGHPRTPENTYGKTRGCCRTCQRIYKAKQKALHRSGRSLGFDYSGYSRNNLAAAPHYDKSVIDAEIRAGTQELLRAIWREHPDIMRNLAERGRFVAHPDSLAA